MGARLLVVALAVLGAAAPGASAATDAFTVHYEGNYAWHQDWEGGGRTAGSYLRTNETLSWVVNVTGSKAGPGIATDLHVRVAAQGTIDVQGSDPNSIEHCTITQAEGAGARDAVVSRNADNTLNVGLGLPANVGPDLTVTGNHQNCDAFGGSILLCSPESCGGATVCGAVPTTTSEPSFAAAFEPTLDEVKNAAKPFDVAGPRSSDTVACASGGTETTQIAINSSVRVNAGGAVAHPPPHGQHISTIERQKTFAKGDLLPTIFRAEGACGTVALATTALVWGTTVPGAGGAAAIAGDLMLAGAGPDCVALVERIYDDIQIIDDPPLHDFLKLARPAPIRTPVVIHACANEPAAPAGFCTALRADVISYVAAVRKATAIADALQITFDRESGAARAGAGAALKAQERTGARLLGELQVASRAERAAGAKLAAQLGTQHVTGSLTAAQVSGGIARITGLLEKRGTAASRLPSGSLTPTPIDLVAALTR